MQQERRYIRFITLLLMKLPILATARSTLNMTLGQGNIRFVTLRLFALRSATLKVTVGFPTYLGMMSPPSCQVRTPIATGLRRIEKSRIKY